MYTKRSKYWPAYTWKIQTSYSSIIRGKLSDELNISESDFEKIYFDIFHKINASFYHLEQLKENEEIAIQTGKDLATIKVPGTEGMVGIVGSPYEPIGYEYEAFLVTIKSTLDFISILLAKGFNRREDDIISLVNNIRVNKAESSTLEGEIYALLSSNKYQTLIKEYRGSRKGPKSKRNFATHIGSLPIGTINVSISNLNASPLLSKALDPNSSNPYTSLLHAQNLVAYCENQLYQTCDLLIEILSLLSTSELKHGPRSSVYEERITASKQDK